MSKIYTKEEKREELEKEIKGLHKGIRKMDNQIKEKESHLEDKIK